VLKTAPNNPRLTPESRQAAATPGGVVQADAAGEAAVEQRVQERTAQIVAALRELESFSLSVSHDLRAPLRAIRGYAAILIDEHSPALPPEALDLVARMSAAAGRIDALSDGLLALAKSGRVPLRRSEVNLSDMACAILAELRQSDSARVLVSDIEPGVLTCADPVLARDVLQNLLGNAWKYTSKKPLARIAFKCSAGAGEPVFSVSDDGAGFDMAYASKLFQSFERLHSMSEFEGTGLGLATVHRIVERHGGRIWVKAEPGRGATFYFTFGAEACAGVPDGVSKS
jgi:signal transduction histidine kinase